MTGGELVRREEPRRRRHRCRPPNALQRFADAIGPGSVWRCDCGKTYRLDDAGGEVAPRWREETDDGSWEVAP